MKSKKSGDLGTIILTLLACALSGTIVFLIITKVVAPILSNDNTPGHQKKS